MGWIEISIPASIEDSEIVADTLNHVVNWQGIVEVPQKEKIIYKVYFPEGKDLKENFRKLRISLRELNDFGASVDLGQISWALFEEDDWSKSWQRFYKPVKVGEKVVVKAPWLEYEKKEDEILLDIKPAMAFGVGTHETTKLAIIFLEKYGKGMETILDFGCGTGILAIIACHLGAKAYAADYDILSIEALKENLALNNLSGKVEFFHLDNLKDFPYKVNMIVANILADVFKELRNQFYPVLKEDGILILSGIIEEQRDEIYRIFCEEGFTFIEEGRDGEWVSLVFKK